MAFEALCELLRPRLLYAARCAMHKVNREFFIFNPPRGFRYIAPEDMCQPIENVLANEIHLLADLNTANPIVIERHRKKMEALYDEIGKLQRAKDSLIAEHYKAKEALIEAREAHRKGLLKLRKTKDQKRREFKQSLKMENSQLIAEIAQLRIDARKLRVECEQRRWLLQIGGTQYPSVPAPICKASEARDMLPRDSGVYFVWDGEVVVYVGLSVNLNQRAWWETHDKIKKDESLSWIALPETLIGYAEAYYIGLCQPKRNGENRTNK